MKIIVTGGKGRLGLALKENCGNNTLYNPGKDELDVTDVPLIYSYILSKEKTDLIIHCAAITFNKLLELKTGSDGKYLMEQVNCSGTTNVSAICAELRIKMIYISTEDIFDNSKEKFTEKDDANPMTYYAKTKWYGEAIAYSYGHKIFRLTKFQSLDFINNVAKPIILCAEESELMCERILHVGIDNGKLDLTRMKCLLGID